MTGLIEAATIECERDLFANGGIAGRERGHLDIKGNLVAKYLDAVTGSVGGDVRTQREIINCNLVIHGAIDSPQGSIIGGKLIVQGAVHVGSLGSPAAVPTELVLETVPSLDGLAQRLNDILARFDQRRTARLQELEQLRKLCVRGNVPEPIQAQLRSLAATLRRLDDRLKIGRFVQDHLTQYIQSKRTICVTVDRRVHAGVILSAGDRIFCITNDLKGPVTFRRDNHGVLVYAHGDAPAGPLAQITTSKRPAK